ncbi:hypothetical protein KAR48_03925 [bacterium]|nr:hypothetical protein [bacterium]
MLAHLRRSPLLRIALGVVVGAVLGFIYYKFIGCASGTCPITRNPISTTLYGALIGGLLASNG